MWILQLSIHLAATDFSANGWNSWILAEISRPRSGYMYHTIALISWASKVMRKILQDRFQQYVNRELPDVQAGFGKGRERNQRSNYQHLLDHRIIKRIPEKYLLLLH